MNPQFLVALVLVLVGVVVLPMQVAMPLWGEIQQKQAQIGEKKASVETLTGSVQALQAQVARLQQVKALPEGVQIRTAAEADVTSTVKDLLDDVVLLAGHLGNDLISLEPSKAGAKSSKELPEAAKPLTAKEKRAAAAKAAKGNPTGEETVDETPKIQAKSYDYTVVVRGTYSAIQALMNALANHPDLIEVKLLELTNEGGNDREQILMGTLKVNKPMRASLQLSIWLMPPVLNSAMGVASNAPNSTAVTNSAPMSKPVTAPMG